MALRGRFSANGFHTSGTSQIRLCRENKVTLLPWTDMGYSILKVSVFLHVGLGESYNNLPPNPLPLANATEKYAICPRTKVNHFSDANLVRYWCLS